MMRLLTIISFHFLFVLGNSFDMQCDYVKSSWYIVGNVKNCYARNLTIRSPHQSVDSVNGQNTTILEDVIGFWIENEICHYIPQKMVVFMPNLKAFGLENAELKTISKFDLAPFPELIRVAFYRNELEYLDGDVFSMNPKIQSLNLEDNNLLIINGHILKPLGSLHQAVFKLPCLEKKCEDSRCIPEMNVEFGKNCEFDSIYPGFIKYFKSLKRTVEGCSKLRQPPLK